MAAQEGDPYHIIVLETQKWLLATLTSETPEVIQIGANCYHQRVAVSCARLPSPFFINNRT